MPPQPDTEPALLLMVKAPQPGAVKTRLLPHLSEAESAALAACFAQDVAAGLCATGTRVLIAYAPDDIGRALLEPLLPEGLLWIPQGEGDLGARIMAALSAAFSLGFGPVVVLGTDSPTLPPVYIIEALHLLAENRADLVLGPTEDGGYYLVGVKTHQPELFQEVAWSTPQARADTLRNAYKLGIRAALLPAWYDIDTIEDLKRLDAELRQNTALKARVPQTSRWLRLHRHSLEAFPEVST